MKSQSAVNTTDKYKIIIVNCLYVATMIIIFLGLFFSIFSLVNHINFKVLNSSVPGVVFGVLVLYLGIRYYFSVDKFKEELFNASSEFAWSNFKGRKLKKLFPKK